MKVKYPIEAFALAMIVFSQNMQDALITGILILFLTTFGLVINKYLFQTLPKWSRDLCVILSSTALTFSLFQIVLIRIFNLSITMETGILHVFIGALIAKHIIDHEEDDFNRLLFEGAGAYAAFLLIGLLREFLAQGNVFGNNLTEMDFMTVNFSSIAFGFLLTGIALAILNRIYDYKDLKLQSLYVIIPVILVNYPFLLDGVNESVAIGISVVATIILVISIKKFLVFSNTGSEWKRLPIDLVSTAFLYMILAVF